MPNLAYLSSIEPEKLIELTNYERSAIGLNPLTANQLLTQAAILKGREILAANTFNHTINDKKFSAWVRDTGYQYSYVGENLAIDFATSDGVMKAWNNSPLHKKNLLSPYYQEIGIAVIPGTFKNQETTVVVQIFGAPAAIPLASEARNTEALNYNFSNANFSDRQYGQAENLLTHSITVQEISPKNINKLSLPGDNYRESELNTFVIQPNYRQTMNNYLLTFISLIAAYLIILFYYFFKINKLFYAQNIFPSDL